VSAVIRIDRNDYITSAHEQLRREFLECFLEHPACMVRIPESGERKSVAWIVEDNFDGRDGGSMLFDLLRIVRDAAKRGDEAATRWVAQQAEQFATDHDTDLAWEMELDAEEAARGWK